LVANDPCGVQISAGSDYAAWRDDRWEEVAGYCGKAGVVAVERIDDADQVMPDVPGQWTATVSTLSLAASPGDGITLDGELVDGRVDVPVGSRLGFSDGRAGFIGGSDGTYGLHVWDPSSRQLSRLRDIQTYDPNPRWSVEAEYRRAPIGREIEIQRLGQSSGTEMVAAPADLIFEFEGSTQHLVVIESVPGLQLAVFTDETTGMETPEHGRWLVVPKTDSDRVVLDLNRVILPHHVFSEVFPCPVPPRRNHLPLAVTAGERAAVWDPHPPPELKTCALQYLRCLERQDYDGMRSAFTEDATIWHNTDGVAQSVEENLQSLRDNVFAVADTLEYVITRQLQEGDELLQQHVVKVTWKAGGRARLDAAAYFRFRDGLIERLEEYAHIPLPDPDDEPMHDK